MIHHEEVRCDEETANRMLNEGERPLYMPSVSVQAALGIPLIVSEDVPTGRIQFWQDGVMVKEVEL